MLGAPPVHPFGSGGLRGGGGESDSHARAKPLLTATPGLPGRPCQNPRPPWGPPLPRGRGRGRLAGSVGGYGAEGEPLTGAPVGAWCGGIPCAHSRCASSGSRASSAFSCDCVSLPDDTCVSSSDFRELCSAVANCCSVMPFGAISETLLPASSWVRTWSGVDPMALATASITSVRYA